ncbi:MAG: hypothetical protein A2X78_04885 [Gammaproteobacteria bacterium GWE2_37_16]|nr:MAG: hypothetical protein A2X78_04885 [Gammaproteobacteria bacterium GWE2_37_16]
MFLLLVAPLAEVSLPALIARYLVLGNRGRLPARQEVALMGDVIVFFVCFVSFLYVVAIQSLVFLLVTDMGETRYRIYWPF